MNLRHCLLFAFAALPGAPVHGADAAPPVETMAEHRLKEIVQHQKDILADAAAQGDNMEQAALQNRAEGLTREYESLIKDNPQFAAGFTSYGYFLWKIGMRKQAAKMLLKANELDPDIPLVKNELGNYLAEEGKPLEALNYFLAATKLEPNEPLYHYEIGKLLHEARDDFIKSGEWTQASIDHGMQDAFRIAAELAPDRIEFTYRYAESFYDMEDPDWSLALKQWRKLEAGGQSELERETMRLHEVNVLIFMGKRDEARTVLDSIKDPSLGAQKQKLVARLTPTAEK